MKDALDVHRLRRIGVPGIILALGVHPFIAAWLNPYAHRTYGFTSAIILGAEIVLFGLIASGATTFIYYVYEGFRLPVLTRLARRRNERKLREAVVALRRLYDGRNPEEWNATEAHEQTKLSAYIADFPLVEHRGQLTPCVERPTRLGNIVAAYELYGESRYNVDLGTYWHHVLSCAPDSTRQDFEDAVSFAESLLLASAAGLLVSFIASTAFVGLKVGAWNSALVVATTRVSLVEAAALAVGGLGCWWVFYQLTLAAHREVGSIFRALVDVSIGKFFVWAQTVRIPPDAAQCEHVAIVAEYLVHGTSPPAEPVATNDADVAAAVASADVAEVDVIIVTER